MRDLETWMWAEACEILDRADRLHRQFFRPTITNVKQPCWEPPIDIYESPYEFMITIALPGVAPEHLNITLDKELLVINGHRYLPSSTESHVRRLEIPYGRFERRIQLTSARFEINQRELVNGCLLISLRKL